MHTEPCFLYLSLGLLIFSFFLLDFHLVFLSFAVLLHYLHLLRYSCFFFFNDTATTEIYTLSLHDALPISPSRPITNISSATSRSCRATGTTTFWTRRRRTRSRWSRRHCAPSVRTSSGCWRTWTSPRSPRMRYSARSTASKRTARWTCISWWAWAPLTPASWWWAGVASPSCASSTLPVGPILRRTAWGSRRTCSRYGSPTRWRTPCVTRRRRAGPT